MRSSEYDPTLLAQAQSRDRAAFWKLAAPSIDALFRLARRLSGSNEAAEEIVSRACLTALDKIREFTGQCRFTAWLHGITLEEALRGLGMRCTDIFPEEAQEAWEAGYPEIVVDWSAAVLEEAARGQAASELESAIAELPLDLAAIIVLRDINRLSNEEAAQVLGLPIGAVRWRVRRARYLLQARLHDFFSGGRAFSDSPVTTG